MAPNKAWTISLFIWSCLLFVRLVALLCACNRVSFFWNNKAEP